MFSSLAKHHTAFLDHLQKVFADNGYIRQVADRRHFELRKRLRVSDLWVLIRDELKTFHSCRRDNDDVIFIDAIRMELVVLNPK